MNPIVALCACALFSSVSVVAQFALPPGVSKASEDISPQVQSSAAELLSRYIKKKDGNFLLHMNIGSSDLWVDQHGLALSHVMPQPLSAADRAKGIKAAYAVSVQSERYRTYDPKTTQWSEWHNGVYLLLPRAIRVAEGRNGQLTAECPGLTRFMAFTSAGNAQMIPRVRKPVVQQAVSLPKIQIPAPASSTTGGVAPAEPNPIQVVPQGLFNQLLRFALVLVVFGVLVSLLATKRRGIRPYARLHHRSPPPLPVSASYGTDHSLIVGQTHLLTPAERSFFAVLEPIVRPSCTISSKVRLADLFQVKQGRGQQSAFNRISRKHVDFVLTDPATSRILCAIELDDASHNRPDRVARDQFVDKIFASNRMPLIHIPFQWQYNPDAIRDEIVRAGIPLMPSMTSPSGACSPSLG